MKHEQIDDKARVWVVSRGTDGQLLDEFDPGLFARLDTGHSAEEIADTLIIAAGEMEIAETRVW
jgi:hypothetical protein